MSYFQEGVFIDFFYYTDFAHAFYSTLGPKIFICFPKTFIIMFEKLEMRLWIGTSTFNVPFELCII